MRTCHPSLYLVYVGGFAVCLPLLAFGMRALRLPNQLIQVAVGLSFVALLLSVIVIGAVMGRLWVTLLGIIALFFVVFCEHLVLAWIIGKSAPSERELNILLYLLTMGAAPTVVLCLILHGVARVVIKARAHQMGAFTCRTCGYDLTANVSGRCPECGAEIREKGSET